MSKILLSITLSSLLFSAGVVVPDDYNVIEDETLSYVYGDEYAGVLPDIKAYQKEVMSTYEKEFGFKLDDELRVGLATSNNQIANGFATPVPFNMQLFYGSGASYVDYFCFSSWLKTLLIHETAHSYQLNPKENFISKTGHKIFGNSVVTFLGLFPVFTIPNVTESSFMFEGNAVMNESRFGNGGRLFSGYALAEVVALAKAGKITPQLMYNSTLEFPYGEHFYLVGGFFQKFLVERYGVEKVNGYFKRYSAQPFPFFTNIMFRKQFGKTFEVLLKEFSDEMKSKHLNAKHLKGRLVAKSKMFVPFNRDHEEIYTLIGDRKSEPQLLRVKRQTKEVTLESDDWREGELFKVGGDYYSQSSAYTSPTKIEMGLFDDDGFIKEGTEGRVVQGYLKNGKMVYIDIKKSLDAPAVYVDGVFYAQSHSSVHVNNNDIYYFVQKGEQRTLYKNKKALYSYRGHYGFVSDVDASGAVYFIASSAHGSTVYRVKNGMVRRVNGADDIIDFKLLNNHEALVATIGAEGYGYYQVPFNQGVLASPFSPKVVAEKGAILGSRDFRTRDDASMARAKSYNSLTQMEYSSFTPFVTYDETDGYGAEVSVLFMDPLLQNQAVVVGSYNKSRGIFGLQYDSNAFPLEFGGAVYGVAKNSDQNNSEYRDAGYDAYAKLPLFKSGYWDASTTLTYTKPYDALFREPLTLSLDVSNAKHYGLSKYSNSLNALSIFASNDRDNNIYGGTYTYKHDLPWEMYVGLEGTYMKSDEVNSKEKLGVEIDSTLSDLQSDRGTLDMPSLSSALYAQEVKMGEVSLKKVFNLSKYFYSAPISLQRESLYVKQRHYDIDFSDTVQKSYDETRVGAEFDLLFLHKFTIPLSLEFIHNSGVQDQARLLIGGSF